MKPNIVVCTCDQLRAFATGCYGDSVARTPNIDRLAAEGTRVEHAVTNAPVCMAARSVLLSGQYNRTCTGGIGNVGYPSFPGHYSMPEYPFAGRPHLKNETLPERLRANGYHTRAIGKWHIHSWPHDIGFDHYLIPRVHHCHTGQHYTENGGREFVAPGFSVDFEAERVASFLTGRKATDEPFFLYYNISPPHCPLDDAPEKYTRMFAPGDVPLRANASLEPPIDNQDYHFKVWLHDFRYYSFHLPYTDTLPEGFSLAHLYALYYGMVAWVDDAVGRMMAALETNGLAENTIVVFTADHGDMLASHGSNAQKGTAYEESIRIPMIVRWPGKTPPGNSVDDQVAGLVDLAPTLLSAAGLDVPPCMHGDNRWSAMTGIVPSADVPRHAIVECFVPASVAIRTPQLVYSLPRNEAGTLANTPNMVFDLQADPYELNNLADSAALPPACSELDTVLRDWDTRTPKMEGQHGAR